MAVALAFVAALGLPSAASACSRSPYRGVRFPGHSHLVVMPGDRMVSAARGLPAEFAKLRPEPGMDEQIFRPRRWWWWKARLSRWLDRLRPKLPSGQVVRVERAGGPDSLRLRTALPESRGDAIVVQWGTSSDCRTVLNRHRKPSLKPGQRVFVTARLRDEAGWVGGRPTFDQTSDDVLYWEREYWRSELGLAPRLTLAEFWTLYQALPPLDMLRVDTARALAQLRDWVREHPELMSREPVAGEVDMAGNFAQSSSRHPRASPVSTP